MERRCPLPHPDDRPTGPSSVQPWGPSSCPCSIPSFPSSHLPLISLRTPEAERAGGDSRSHSRNLPALLRGLLGRRFLGSAYHSCHLPSLSGWSASLPEFVLEGLLPLGRLIEIRAGLLIHPLGRLILPSVLDQPLAAARATPFITKPAASAHLESARPADRPSRLLQ
jgi:hypothetical protein